MLGLILADRYRLEEPLGEGGFAEVYRARDLRTEAPVAVKVLHASEDVGLRARFRQEALLLAGLDHPHIVRVLDFAADERLPPFLVMEYVEGPSLRQVLRERAWATRAAGDEPAPPAAEPLIPPPLVVQVARSLLDALGYLHARGVVHRDLKPENVVLGQDGVKLVDFGLARPPSEVNPATTTRFTVLGTLPYMAPEQALGLSVDGRTDLYALGVVLYELLAGEWPYSADALLGLATGDSQIAAPPQPPAHPALPPALAPIVLRLLSMAPGQRYQDAAAAVEALDAAAVWIDRLQTASGVLTPPAATPASARGRPGAATREAASVRCLIAAPSLPLPSVLAGLPAGVLRLLAGRLVEHQHARGDVVLRQGDPGESLHLVAAGRFVVEQERPDGSVQRIATVGPGEFFGELALIDGEPRSATVRATTRATTRVLARSDFLAVVREHPDVALAIMARLTRMVRNMNQQLTESPAAARRRAPRRAARHG
jgi:serine/threonine-protein kinase